MNFNLFVTSLSFRNLQGLRIHPPIVALINQGSFTNNQKDILCKNKDSS